MSPSLSRCAEARYRELQSDHPLRLPPWTPPDDGRRAVDDTRLTVSGRVLRVTRRTSADTRRPTQCPHARDPPGSCSAALRCLYEKSRVPEMPPPLLNRGLRLKHEDRPTGRSHQSLPAGSKWPQHSSGGSQLPVRSDAPRDCRISPSRYPLARRATPFRPKTATIRDTPGSPVAGRAQPAAPVTSGAS
jgi:hypothetical protein